MDSPASTLAADVSSIMSRLAALDLIVEQTRRDMFETLELIDRMREHYLHLQGKFSDAEREQASLVAEATRFYNAATSTGRRG
jgi:hypothetical protein